MFCKLNYKNVETKYIRIENLIKMWVFEISHSFKMSLISARLNVKNFT